MSEVLFVSPEFLKATTNLSSSVTDDRMVPAIILAQDKHIQIYLGSRLMKKLKTDISGNSLSGAYADLVDDYVRKATCWWTYMELLPNLYVQIENGGLVQRTSDDAQAAQADDLHRESERARQNAQFYTYRMYQYITNNVTLFPEYNRASKEEILATPADYHQSGMIVSRSTSRQGSRVLHDYRHFFKVT